VAADWQSRALTLAELQEAGYEVTAVPGLRYALAALAHHRLAPALILLDVHGDDDATPERVGDLRALAPGVPLVLVVGAFEQEVWEPLRNHVAVLLRRPVTVGALVEAAATALAIPREKKEQIIARANC
jgi:DNA-binding NtrC family response regulator